MSGTLSDFNSSSQKSILVSSSVLSSDLDTRMIVHPITGDVRAIKDLAAITNSVKNIVLTNFFERPFQPRLAANIRALLFEPADNFTIVSIQENITVALQKHEPRITDIKVQVSDNSERNEYNVILYFRIKNINEYATIEFPLKRYR